MLGAEICALRCLGFREGICLIRDALIPDSRRQRQYRIIMSLICGLIESFTLYHVRIGLESVLQSKEDEKRRANETV